MIAVIVLLLILALVIANMYTFVVETNIEDEYMPNSNNTYILFYGEEGIDGVIKRGVVGTYDTIDEARTEMRNKATHYNLNGYNLWIEEFDIVDTFGENK